MTALTPEAVAEGLSPIQRQLCVNKPQWLSHTQALQFPMVGMVERMPNLPQKWRLTPLGLAVRAALLSRDPAP